MSVQPICCGGSVRSTIETMHELNSSRKADRFYIPAFSSLGQGNTQQKPNFQIENLTQPSTPSGEPTLFACRPLLLSFCRQAPLKERLIILARIGATMHESGNPEWLLAYVLTACVTRRIASRVVTIARPSEAQQLRHCLPNTMCSI